MRKSRFAVGAVLAACLAASAWAHDDNVLDLEALETYAAQRVVETQGGEKAVYRAWKQLSGKLGKSADGKLAKDLGKLASLSKAANVVLADDAQLRTLLDSAIEDADQKLAAEPDAVATLIGQIRKDSARDRVTKAVLAARDLHDEGRLAGTQQDEKTELKLWKKSNAGFVKARKLANQAINGQGGPLPQFKTPAPKRVYTVVGRGEGGFNGDGREARRTLLYFVEECRIGPDGLLYILDWNNHMLRRRTADGRIERLCGSGTPGDSEGAPMTTNLNHPSSLVFDGVPGGKVFLAAWHNHKVKVYDPVGGQGGTPTVYTIAGTIQGGGTDIASGDGGLATLGKFNLLPGVVRLPSGDLLVADAGNEVVRHIDLTPGTDAPNLVGTTVHTGTVTRFAGTRGTPGITGDDGDRLACTLNFSRAQNADPDGRMELSPDGNTLYVICGQGHCIRAINMTTGVITRFAGTGTGGYAGDDGQAKDAQLNRPSDIAVAADGTVYISDAGNNVIRKVAPDGTITTFAGATDGSAGPAADDIALADVKFAHPAGLELDADGNLYVCDRENSVIRVITSDTPGTSLVLPIVPFELPAASQGGPPAKGATGTIATYAGHAPDAEGTNAALMEANAFHLGFNGDGRLARDTDMYWPQDLAVDPAASPSLVHIVDWNNHRIRRIEDDGTITTIVGSGRLGDQGGEGPDAKLNHPTDITFHPTTGELWIAAWHTDKILRLDGTTNAIVYMAGGRRAFTGDGLSATTAEMNLPSSVKFTANGDWYIGDEGNQRVRWVTHDTNIIDTLAGNGVEAFAGDDGPAKNASINLPVGQEAQPAGRICISPDEHWLYIADTDNNRVRRVDLTVPERTITTYAGNGTKDYTGDDGQATAAALSFPSDVDCDAAGNLYIADRDNHVIRRVDAVTKVITTFAGSGVAGFSGDGGAATGAMLNAPAGLFVMRAGPTAGRVYVADTYNGIVRVIWE
jgi:sugar lactone lactonase YvrE